MSIPTNLPARRTLSTRATTLYAVITAISFSASSSAPTPLYHVYQQSMGLSSLTVTLIFASYAFTMVATFLTVARLSDYVGRRPMILSALLLNGISLALFITAASAPHLILARLIQGVAISIGMATLGATILDTDRKTGPIFNSITAFLGLAVGSLLGGLLVAWAPLPLQLVFLVLLAVTIVEAVTLIFVPESTTGKPGALRVLIPYVNVPASVMPVLLRLMPLNIAAWALGGFYLSLMPTLVAVATGITSIFVGASVVSVLMVSAAATVLLRRHMAPERLLQIASLSLALGVAVTLAGVYLQSAPVMLLGTLISGTGFGSAYSGNFRTLLPLAKEHERAGLLAAYFVESYLAFAIPAILAGLSVTLLGLVATSQIYGAVLIALALISARFGGRRLTRLVEA
ncbi:MAG: MFS transporter [Rhodobacteraceae bacterium]|nr:MFS transporter [Paracoccaceae bacterium]